MVLSLIKMEKLIERCWVKLFKDFEQNYQKNIFCGLAKLIKSFQSVI